MVFLCGCYVVDMWVICGCYVNVMALLCGYVEFFRIFFEYIGIDLNILESFEIY